MEFFTDFHKHRSFVKALNSTFLIMILKKTGPTNISELPRSLIGCIYKLLSKVLAKRLSKVMHKIIGECQHAFVHGR